MKKRVAVLISGSGSNLQALIDAAQAPDYPAEIVCVISNRPAAYGLKRAAHHNIDTHIIDHKLFENRDAFEQALHEKLAAAKVEIICLAGFMRILTAGFVNQWAGRILNIHPSLLPAFKGLNVQQQALDAGVKESGCTVHVVTPDLDDGPIIGQRAVPVKAGDTAETLSERILREEHMLYPQCLARFALNGLEAALKTAS
ncbi:phosphoribosylglycinamide formyltransferase [Parvularcula sp. IMCC14364]|uniref:phosphoribosylglycinamide formyltransferase n=1 Tax=Parvularcula sp. IMCC14364 TaxID=3067902 RepID=UPI002741067E|nr:phosphoribosylglycinamide formyltransferase [Parvularcula sp. IMCC14364]